MGFSDNFRKVVKLYKISKVLKASAAEADRQTRETAENELFDLVESCPDLESVLEQYGATRDGLRELYQILRTGADAWVKSNYVPASALAFEKPLKYVLKNAGDLKTSEERKKQICRRLFFYFQGNEIGEVKEYRARKRKPKLAHS